MILVLLDNLLEIPIFSLTNFTKLPVLIYFGICNVLLAITDLQGPAVDREYLGSG